MFTLRPVQFNDLPLILEWRNRPEIRKLMFTTHEISTEEHYAYFERSWNDLTKRHLLCVAEDGTPVGVVNLNGIDVRNRNAFWGFYSGDPSQRGIGTWMGYLALNYAFDVLELHKLMGEVLSTNEPSLHFHKKLGFQLEGVFKEQVLTPEGFADVHRFAHFQNSWVDEWRPKVEARLRRTDDQP